MPRNQSAWEQTTPNHTLAFLREFYSDAEALRSARRQLWKATSHGALVDAAFWLAVIALLQGPRRWGKRR